MALTMVIVAGDIDLSFPARSMSLGHGRLRRTLAGDRQRRSWRIVGALGVGVLCGLFNGFFVTVIGIPALVVTIGTQFLFRGLALVLVGGQQYPLVDDAGLARVPGFMVGKLFGDPDGVLLVPARARSAPGCCSTGTASGRTPTSPATTRRRPR